MGFTIVSPSQTDLICRKVDYLERKMYNAFYSFESLTKRSSGDMVCGICGQIPDVLLGDHEHHLPLITFTNM